MLQTYMEEIRQLMALSPDHRDVLARERTFSHDHRGVLGRERGSENSCSNRK
jgi:hypothetical protein